MSQPQKAFWEKEIFITKTIFSTAIRLKVNVFSFGKMYYQCQKRGFIYVVKTSLLRLEDNFDEPFDVVIFSQQKILLKNFNL